MRGCVVWSTLTWFHYGREVVSKLWRAKGEETEGKRRGGGERMEEHT
jgi:hypothetical protein